MITVILSYSKKLLCILFSEWRTDLLNMLLMYVLSKGESFIIIYYVSVIFVEFNTVSYFGVRETNLKAVWLVIIE